MVQQQENAKKCVADVLIDALSYSLADEHVLRDGSLPKFSSEIHGTPPSTSSLKMARSHKRLRTRWWHQQWCIRKRAQQS